jgi:hypothetical protein
VRGETIDPRKEGKPAVTMIWLAVTAFNPMKFGCALSEIAFYKLRNLLQRFSAAGLGRVLVPDAHGGQISVDGSVDKTRSVKRP